MFPVQIEQFEMLVAQKHGIAGPVFPQPERFPGDVPIAFGGELSPERLMLAYTSGIFPWYSDGQPIMWWAPDPRCQFDLDTWKPNRSLKKVINRGGFEVTFNQAFARVMNACAQPRNYCAETWITSEMFDAYNNLFGLGYAHSVEVWSDGVLSGGLYGIAINADKPVFFGESIFHKKTNMGKIAVWALIERLRELGFGLLDCQMPNGPLNSIGATALSRRAYMDQLAACGVTPQTHPETIVL